MSRLQEVMDRLEHRVAARAALRPPPAPAAPAPASEVLPPLFGALSPEPRAYLGGVLVTLPGGGMQIHYRGEALRADDRAVWFALLGRLDQQGRVSFASNGLLRILGWGVTRHDRQRLRSCLERMQATLLRLPLAGGQCGLPLITRAEWTSLRGGRSDRWQVQIDPAIAQLFGARQLGRQWSAEALTSA